MKYMGKTKVCGRAMLMIRLYLTCAEEADGGIKVVTSSRGNPLLPTCFEKRDEVGGYATFLRPLRSTIVTVAKGDKVEHVIIKKHRVTTDGTIETDTFYSGRIDEMKGEELRFREAARRALGTPPCFHCECEKVA